MPEQEVMKNLNFNQIQSRRGFEVCLFCDGLQYSCRGKPENWYDGPQWNFVPYPYAATLKEPPVALPW